MIARKIRYDFFKQVMDLNKLTVLVTAHHLDDQIETFFINLFRGSGLKGLSGMKEFKKEIYRPFLNNTRDQLEIYAKKNELIWREDSSNQKNDYLRNKIRLDLIPKMFEIQPNYKNQIIKSIQYIQEAETIIEENSKSEFTKVLHHFDEKTETYFLKLNKLKSLNSTFLYYIFNDFGGFHSNELPKFLNSVSGTTLENEMFKFWIDFKFLIIEPKKEFIPTYIELSTYKFKLKHPIKLKSKVLEQMDSTAEAWFDADKIILPLIIRTWKNDDIFFPLGMNGRKKVSKLLKDEKISNYYKQNIMVLTNAKNEIIWVVNHRTDERFKVTNQTKKILNIWI